MTLQTDIVVSGVGVMSQHGLGLTRHLAMLTGGRPTAGDKTLKMPDLVGQLANPKLTKTLFIRDVIGLVALEDAARQTRFEKGRFPASRVGLSVGAPAASAADAEPYKSAMTRAMKPSGPCSAVSFGQACDTVRPTAMLNRLPNNVLCYGSIILDAEGPNSNYVSGPTSGQLAVLSAARRIRRKQLDCAFAGGHGFASEAFTPDFLGGGGVTGQERGKDAELVDGAAFVMLERRESAVARGLSPLVSFVGAGAVSACLQPGESDAMRGLAATIQSTLHSCGVNPLDVGLVFLTPCADAATAKAIVGRLKEIFAEKTPAVASLSILGDLMEASGLIEIGVIPYFWTRESLPENCLVQAAIDAGFSPRIDSLRRYALVITATSTGEHVCMLWRV
jgi:3-oxoacyl-(acyl-carrier-protein) synthase